ncbi:alpha/beta hydrolase [Archangium minus]|uniref:Alpha/beta hydrolase n=1 Tax=Archangium minus TaxID=83450 RepID=A0ABY9X2Z4_9BACT|nr:alpha/beta hydrolase [Archangium minus]
MRAQVLEAGEGPVLLLLSSMLVRARTYLPLIRRLSKHFRVLTVELPGCGRSARVRRPWTLSAYARWTARLMQQLLLGHVVLVGHSNSGGVALLVAARYGGCVDRLVLADSIGARRERSIPRVVGARMVDAFLEWGLNLRAWWHIVYNALRHPRSFFHQVKVGSLAALLRHAPQVRRPTLLAWGRRDHTMPLSCADRLRERMPRAQVYVGSGSHDWLITDSQEFTRAVLAFAARGEVVARLATQHSL